MPDLTTLEECQTSQRVVLIIGNCCGTMTPIVPRAKTLPIEWTLVICLPHGPWKSNLVCPYSHAKLFFGISPRHWAYNDPCGMNQWADCVRDRNIPAHVTLFINDKFAVGVHSFGDLEKRVGLFELLFQLFFWSQSSGGTLHILFCFLITSNGNHLGFEKKMVYYGFTCQSKRGCPRGTSGTCS